MALINCSECGKEISDKAAACPNCGNPIERQAEPSTTPPSYTPPFVTPAPIKTKAQNKPKKPWYKRVWVWLLIVFVGLPMLSGIIGGLAGGSTAKETSTAVSSSSAASSSSNVESSEPVQSEKSVSAEPIRGGTIGDFDVYVTGLRFVKGYSDEHMVAITYSFANNSKESAAFMYKISETIFQDGIELDTSFMKTPGVDSDVQSREIKPGVTIDVEKSYILSSESDIEIELDNWISISSKDKIQFTIPYSEIAE